MAFSAPSGGVITQTGTDTSLAGLVGNAGVTVTALTHLDIYDLGTNRLRIDGTLTINGVSDADREMLVLGVDGATQNVDIDIGSTGTLIVGSIDSQVGVDFNQEQFWPSIYEDAATDFGDGNGNISNDGGTTDAFINVEGGGRLEWYGCINSTGGMRFKGARDGVSGDEAQVVIRGGVLDARRMTERGSGEADNFIYNYSDELDIQSPNGDTVGFTILSMTTTGANEKGLAIIQLGQPISLSGYRPVFSSQALGGSNSASIDLAYTVTDYTGIIGSQGTDNIDLRSASIASNTSLITFLNSVKGSVLNLATQDPGFAAIEARQAVRGTLVDAAGANRIDAVLGTENKNNVITQDNITAGAFDLGNILLTEWDDSNPPVATFNNPNNTNDDLWSFYVYSYLGEDRNRIDVRLRGVGGTDVDFIATDDLNITESLRVTVDAYTDIRDLGRFYDRSKSFKVDNIGEPSLDTPVVRGAGNAIDIGALNLRIDGDTTVAYALAAGLITIGTNQASVVTRIGETEAISTGEDDEITIAFPVGIQDDDVAYIAVGHAQSGENAWNTPAGWVIPTGLDEVQTGVATSRPGVTVFRRVLSSDSGSVTITNAGVNTSGIVAQMIVYRGMDTTNPEDVNPTTANNTTGDPDPAAITPANDNAMILTFGFMDDGQQTSPTPPAGYTAILDTQTPDGAGTGE